MSKSKYCMVCGNLAEYDLKDNYYCTPEQRAQNAIKYKNPTCTICGNSHYFIEYDFNAGDPHPENLDRFKDDMVNNPFANQELARQYRNHAKEQRRKAINTFNSKQLLPQSACSSTPNIPKCPTCGSTDIKDISTLNRMVSVGAFGLASDKIGKTKECKNCGYKW